MKATLNAPSRATVSPSGQPQSGVSQSHVSPPLPALQDIVAAICADARKDSVKYILRSDVGHDGE